MKPTKIRYFTSSLEFRTWLAQNHMTATELWVGFYMKHTGRPSMTWPESVDEALCAGWIDGIRKNVDERRYVIRFTPRRRSSIWSAVNIKRANELIAHGLMLEAGLRAFEARSDHKSAIYAYERKNARLHATHEKALRRNREAWAFFRAQPPSYLKVVTWWIVSAKKEETRLKRLAKLIEYSAAGRRL